jgi:hypothetical protein
LAQGLPIGSGEIESARRYVIQQRDYESIQKLVCPMVASGIFFEKMVSTLMLSEKSAHYSVELWFSSQNSSY